MGLRPSENQFQATSVGFVLFYSSSQPSDVQVLHSPLLPLFPLLLLLCPSLPSPFTARGGQLPQLGGSHYLPNWLRTLIAVDNKIQVQPLFYSDRHQASPAHN